MQAMTATRDGLYTAGYLGVCPVLHDYLKQLAIFENKPQGVSFVAAGITAGLAGAIVTHPADTIKTRMQVCSRCMHVLLGKQLGCMHACTCPASQQNLALQGCFLLGCLSR